MRRPLHDPVAYAKRRYDERRMAKQCVRCGRSPLAPGRCTCAPCTANMAKWRETGRARLAKGGPTRWRPWTNREAKALREQYAAGVPMETIAKALGRTAVSIKTQARWIGLSRPPRQRWWLPERVEKLREMHANGELLLNIAEALGVTVGAVWAKTQKLGLRRGSGPNPMGYRSAKGRCACGLSLPCNGCPSIEQYASARSAASRYVG